MKRFLNKRAMMQSIVVLVLIFFSLSVTAHEAQTESSGQSTQEEQTVKKDSSGGNEARKPNVPDISFKPPNRGAPGGRIGGGTRGTTGDISFVTVLAPDQLGLTSETQPALFWYLSKPASQRIELTLNDEQAQKTLVHTALPAPQSGGIQKLTLSDYNVSLTPGTVYRWFITIVVDPEQPSKDIFSGGNVEYMEAPKALKEKIASSDKTAIPAIYAEEGFWYDALSTLDQFIKANPSNETFRKQRTSLLNQGGFPEAAEFETGTQK